MKQAISARVVGYVRVSTDEQSREGVSLDAQAEKVRLYAELHALDLVEVVVDAGVSAKTIDRPGLARALAMLDAGDVVGIVVYKLDRLTRSLGDWSGLIDRYFGSRASLMSVSESIDTRSASGRMVLNVMMTMAQWERETIVERTRHALDYKRSRGERIGTVPYGSDLAEDGKTLVPNEDELDTIEGIRNLAAEGLSLRAIAGRLDTADVPTKSGRPWAASTIHAILKRELDRGK